MKIILFLIRFAKEAALMLSKLTGAPLVKSDTMSERSSADGSGMTAGVTAGMTVQFRPHLGGAPGMVKSTPVCFSKKKDL
jgi:hypothetical protein